MKPTLKSLIIREDRCALNYAVWREQVICDKEKKETIPDLHDNQYWQEMIEHDEEKAKEAKAELDSVRKELADYIRKLLKGEE